ncbi:MAG: sulfur reduction protein DsrE [Desulfocapsaceae bacterium]|nr:sulfur reduction protein DsrE [Desulfocapsaceae bacterium]
MNIALVACSDNPEILWNVFRLGNLMLEKMDDVTIFLNGPSVSYSQNATQEFPLLDLAKLFTLSEGVLLA